MRLRSIRARIALSFCALMLAGGILTTYLAGSRLQSRLQASTIDTATSIAAATAAQLVEPLAYRDRLETRRRLVESQRSVQTERYAFVVDQHGKLFTHSFDFSRFPSALLTLTSATQPTLLWTEDGPVLDVPVDILNGLLGTLHVGLSTKEAEAAMWGTVRRVAATTAAVAAIGMVGIYFLSGLITRSIAVLQHATRRFGEGDMNAQVTIAGRDEITELGVAFNQMATQIRDRWRESESLRRYLQNILDSVDSAVIVLSQDKLIEYANAAAALEGHQTVGRRCSDLLSGERPCVDCPAHIAVETGKQVRRSHVGSSGRVYEITYLAFLGREGTRSVVESAQDVTETREVALRLLRAERLAVAGEVAAGIVHSVNNPLDGVRRALRIASRRIGQGGDATEMLALASEGTDRIANITRSLLNLARVNDPSQRVRVSLSSVTRQALPLVQLKAQSRGVSITLETPLDLPPIRVDPHGINEVVLSLLFNAVDAAGDGGQVAVTVSTERDAAVLMVGDSGAGVEPALREAIFEPFFTTKDSSHGTGLGLSVARRIAELHGGSIRVGSDPLGGARFTLRIPLEPEDSAVDSDLTEELG